MGLVVTIAGVIRTYFIWKSLMDSYDETWFAYPLWIAAAVEIDLAVICACAPAWKSLLQQPIQDFSSRVSSKISSLRSPHNSRGTPETTPTSSSNGRAIIFKPMRSLPWFQVTKLAFEKDHDTSVGRSTQDLENGSRGPFELGVDDHQIELERDIGSREFRHSDVVLNDETSTRPRTTTPTLRIMKRQSVVQESAHISELLPQPRRSVGALRPGQWLGEASSIRFSPKR
ncbi:hypothetical protein LTR08_004449 [Meristemomyces frigidus]|nr:hypothetical protein LTR08_004449 [Meristemomyces frigidus]